MKKIIGPCALYYANTFDVLPELETDSVNWCVTSPPYNLRKVNSDPKKSKSKINLKRAEVYEQWYDDEMPENLYQKEQKQLIKQLLRICTDSIFYNHMIRYNSNLERGYIHPLEWLRAFPIWTEIIWDKCGANAPPTHRYATSHELIYQIQKPRKADKSLGILDVWRIPMQSGTGHVCSFPEKLVHNCLSPHAALEDIVIDPYMGSGTVGVVAIELGLNFIGIENKKENFKLSCSRIQKAYDKQSSSLGFITRTHSSDGRKSK